MRESVFLTVYFDDPFYVGIFERASNNWYQVAKVTFGAEPTLPEIESFILKHFDTLVFTEKEMDTPGSRIKNPKRRKREVRDQLKNVKQTRSQLALSRERESKKVLKKRERRLDVESQQRIRYEKRKAKKKEKHRGH